jgi:hypothetical protein
VDDPLRTPVDRGGPIPQSGRRPSRPRHARDPPLLPTCITMHRCSPAKRPQLPRSARVDDMRHSAAKDRTFEPVRPNQGTASRTVPIRRRPSL